MTTESTAGERKVYALLEKVQNKHKKSFFFRQEYRIHRSDNTVRKPDFVIADAQYGVAVVEVKDWVKIVEGDQENVVIEQRDGTKRTERNPIKIAEAYAQDLAREFEKREELLKRHKGRQKLIFPWQHMVILPNISIKVIQQLESANVFDPCVVLGKEQLQDPTTFYQAFLALPWTFKLPQPLNKAVQDTLRGILNPRAVVINQMGQEIGTATLTQEAMIMEPLPSAEAQQMALFEDNGLSNEANKALANHTIRLIRGVAGSGKTLVLLNRAQYLQERYPQGRIMVVTFNKDLAGHLQQRAPGLEIINFHKLCSRILGKNWHSPQYTSGWLKKYALSEIEQLALPYEDEAERIKYIEEEISWRKDLGLWGTKEYLAADRRGRSVALTEHKRRIADSIFQRYWQHQLRQRRQGGDWMDWDDVPHQAAEALEAGKYSSVGTYDTIMIDEAQDFAPSWLRVLQKLLKPNGTLFLCDDPTQSIFRYFSWKEKGVEVVGRTRILKIPFRNTRQISQAAHSLIRIDPNLSKNEEITLPDLESSEIRDGQLPTLYNFRSSEKEVKYIENEINSLLAQGIPAKEVAILCHSKRLVRHFAHLRNKGFYVDSFQKMKGLEFLTVYIPYLHTCFDQATDEKAVSHKRQQVFTAMTRAKQNLILSYADKLPSHLEAMVPYTWRETL